VALSDPQGFRPPWVVINTFFEDTGFALRLEHGHRAVGFVVGLCGIGLAIGCWFADRRPWIGWIGILALGLICVQGVLGIFRVDYNALHGRTFAMIHGMFAQVVFAVLVSLAVLTSRKWADDPLEETSPALKRWSLVTALLVFGQLLLGGMVRHHDSLLGPRGHLLGAFVVVAAVVWLLKLIRESEARDRFAAARILFMVLLGLQLVLGMESWLARFYVNDVRDESIMPAPLHAEWIRTAHYVVGSLIFATSVSVAILAQRRPGTVAEVAHVQVRELEGAL
jgi:cytochrome c oxidase assembly protein subunit 15